MKTNLTWKKGIFSNTYNIYKDGLQIGIIKNNGFSRYAYSELNGVKYTFKSKGILKQYIQIIEDRTSTVIGEIKFNNWMTKATLSFQNKEAYWKYGNLLNTKWSIFNSEGIQINYSGSSTSGEIESNTKNDLLLLSGLFVTNFHWQMTTAIIIAIFVPIWTAASN